MGSYCSDPDASAIAITPTDHKYTTTRGYICKWYQVQDASTPRHYTSHTLALLALR